MTRITCAIARFCSDQVLQIERINPIATSCNVDIKRGHFPQTTCDPFATVLLDLQYCQSYLFLPFFYFPLLLSFSRLWYTMAESLYRLYTNRFTSFLWKFWGRKNEKLFKYALHYVTRLKLAISFKLQKIIRALSILNATERSKNICMTRLNLNQTNFIDYLFVFKTNINFLQEISTLQLYEDIPYLSLMHTFWSNLPQNK